MHKIIKEYTIYSIDDVMQNEALKQKVIEKNSDINVDYNWYDFLIEDWKENLGLKGFSNAEISFDISYCQGSGASFTCNNIDINKFIKQDLPQLTIKEEKILKALFNAGYINFYIKRIDYMYSHKATVRLESNINIQHHYKRLNKLITKLSHLINQCARLAMDDIYADLQNQYDYNISDEAILETLEANDYEFYADGTIAA